MKDLDRISPNPKIVALLDYALDEVTARLSRKGEYAEWLAWAAEWKKGRRSPQACVDISHFCSDHPDHKGWGIDGRATDPVWHTLGQLAWGAKEACYSAPTSGWLVIRYIADAMTAFGVAYPNNAPALNPPTIESDMANDPPAQIPDGFAAPLDGRTTAEMMADRDGG